jgi:hypothetical protein
MKNVVFWDVSPYGSCRNRHSEGTYRLHLQGESNKGSVLQSVAIANVFGPKIVFTLTMEAIRSSRTSNPARTTQRHIQEDYILQITRRLHIATTWELSILGRPVAKAVSLRLPTAAARDRSGQIMWDLWWTKRHGGMFHSEYLGFHCYLFIKLTAPQSPSSIIQSWYNRPMYGSSNSGLGSTPASKKKKK